MNDIKEIKSNCEYSEAMEMACGPVFTSSIIAEMQIDDNNKEIFLAAFWMNDFEDGLMFFINKKSILNPDKIEIDLEPNSMFMKNNIEIIEEVIDIKTSKYYEQFKKLMFMVFDKMIEKEIDICVQICH